MGLAYVPSDQQNMPDSKPVEKIESVHIVVKMSTWYPRAFEIMRQIVSCRYFFQHILCFGRQYQKIAMESSMINKCFYDHIRLG